MVISKAMLTMLKLTRAPSSIYQKPRQAKVKSLFRSQLARKERPRHPENLGCCRAWALPRPCLCFLNCGYQTSVFSIIQSFWYNNIRPHPDSINKILHMCVCLCTCVSQCVYACACVILWMKPRVLIMLGKYFVTELHSQAADYTFLKITFLSFFCEGVTRERFGGVSSHLPPCASWGSNLGQQAWQQVPLHAELSH